MTAPWTPAQLRLVAGCDAAAIAVVLLAASAVGRAEPARQVVWLDAAVLGLLLAVVANGALFLAARRAVGQRRRRLLPDLVERLEPVRARGADGPWWWVPGTVRAHVAGCQLLDGKAAEAVTAERIRADRLQRCELCG